MRERGRVREREQGRRGQNVDDHACPILPLSTGSAWQDLGVHVVPGQGELGVVAELGGHTFARGVERDIFRVRV